MEQFNSKTNLVIAIDGPAGAGKSTVARDLAQELKLNYLDTGAMYRGIAWYILQKGLDPHNSYNLQCAVSEIDLSIKTETNGRNLVFVNGEEISNELRRPKVSQAVSYVANNQHVRKFLTDKQRKLAKYGGVLDGRDIGTYVFPDADYKFYLTASLSERARRRWQELISDDYDVSLIDIQKEVKERDYYDENRKEHPLKMAEDAILIDTTSMSFYQVVNEIITYINNRVTYYE